MATRKGAGESSSELNQLDTARLLDLGFITGAWTSRPTCLVDLGADDLVVCVLDLLDRPFKCRSLLLAGVGKVEVCLYRCHRLDAGGWTALKSARVPGVVDFGGLLSMKVVDLERDVFLDRIEGPWLVAIRCPAGAGAQVAASTPAMALGLYQKNTTELPRSIETLGESTLTPSVLALTLAGERFYRAADGQTTTLPAAIVDVVGAAPIAVSGTTTKTVSLNDNGVSNAKLRDSAARSVIGRSANTAGDPADIVGAADQVLRVDAAGTTLGFGTVATAGLANDAVTFPKMQNLNTDKLLGRDTAAAGDPEEIGVDTTLEFTGAQVLRRAAITGDVAVPAGSNTSTLSAALKTGRFIKSTTRLSSATHTVDALCNTVRIRMTGGGGGGGGAATAAASGAAGGGGGGGGYLEATIPVTPSTGYVFTRGAGGTGVSAADGNDGGNSTFVVGATTYTAPGGKGGKFMAAAATVATVDGGLAAPIATNGDVNQGASTAGGPGIRLSAAVVTSGDGGATPFSQGTAGRSTAGAGATGGNGNNGGGGGAGGAVVSASAAVAGGNGAPGVIIIDEYT